MASLIPDSGFCPPGLQMAGLIPDSEFYPPGLQMVRGAGGWGGGAEW